MQTSEIARAILAWMTVTARRAVGLMFLLLSLFLSGKRVPQVRHRVR